MTPSTFLPLTAFKIETNCPQLGINPEILNLNTVALPVLPNDPTRTSLPMRLAHIISLCPYSLSGFSFTGSFEGAAVSQEFLDELAVFAASDVVKFAGQEFGFRLSLKNNILYGYVQNGRDFETQKKLFFHNIQLMKSDNKTHSYEARVTSAGSLNYFTWAVDEKILGTFTYAYQGMLYSGQQYHVAATTHRKTQDWSSAGLRLIVGNIAIQRPT